MPFTSSPLGEYPRNPLAVDIFAANLPLAVLATRAMSCWDAGGACLPGPSTPGRMGTARTGGGDHTGYRRVDRPGMGEHHSRQVLLGADPVVQWAVEYKVRTSGRAAARLDSSQQSNCPAARPGAGAVRLVPS